MITSNLSHKSFLFPVGELQVTVDDCTQMTVSVDFEFTKNEDIIELLLFCEAAKYQGHKLDTLRMNYVPFSRQDRSNNPGEAFSLKVFCDLINGLNFETVEIEDPHSDVTPALLNNCVVVNQWDLIAPMILDNIHNTPYWLVAPDAGALKKTHKLAQLLAKRGSITPELDPFMGVIESSKQRNTATGEITGTVIHAEQLQGKVIRKSIDGTYDVPVTYVIVDDICDGGRTFIELAKALRKKGAQRIQLYVTHGFFTKGREVFNGIIDEVFAVNEPGNKIPGSVIHQVKKIISPRVISGWGRDLWGGNPFPCDSVGRPVAASAKDLSAIDAPVSGGDIGAKNAEIIKELEKGQ